MTDGGSVHCEPPTGEQGKQANNWQPPIIVGLETVV